MVELNAIQPSLALFGVLVTLWRPARLSARLADGVVYDLSGITLEPCGFRLCVYKPSSTAYRKTVCGVPSTSGPFFLSRSTDVYDATLIPPSQFQPPNKGG